MGKKISGYSIEFKSSVRRKAVPSFIWEIEALKTRVGENPDIGVAELRMGREFDIEDTKNFIINHKGLKILFLD